MKKSVKKITRGKAFKAGIATRSKVLSQFLF